jgi:6,7-dimethyl-8-ribityllumazine synthase
MADSTTVISGDLVVRGQRFAILVSRFNEFISSRLLDAAIDALQRHGCPPGNITVIWVPGAWELPLAARRAVAGRQYDAAICLGCVIRGETPHFDYVAGESAKGIAQVAFDTDIPIIFGVLTTNSLDEAVNRAGAKAGNKGADAAVAAIEMVNLLARLGQKKQKGGA